jgi:hypothetical protein
MLVIHNRQLAPFAGAVEGEFRTSVARRLRESHGQIRLKLPPGDTTIEAIPEKMLKMLVAGGLHVARSYGLTWQSAQYQFVLIMFLAGPRFHAQSSINKALTDRTLEPNKRIEQVWRKTTDRDWAEAQAAYGSASWAAVARLLAEAIA